MIKWKVLTFHWNSDHNNLTRKFKGVYLYFGRWGLNHSFGRCRGCCGRGLLLAHCSLLLAHAQVKMCNWYQESDSCCWSHTAPVPENPHFGRVMAKITWSIDSKLLEWEGPLWEEIVTKPFSQASPTIDRLLLYESHWQKISFQGKKFAPRVNHSRSWSLLTLFFIHESMSK